MGMGKRETFALNDSLAVKEHIDIERTWGIGKTSFASKVLFDTQEVSQQLLGR